MTAAVDANPLAFNRRADRRVVLGVAGGFADQHGLDPVVGRAALVMLTFVGGLGIVLYVLGYVLTETRRGALRAAQPHDQRRNLSVAAIALGLALVIRGVGLWIDDSVMIVIIVVCAGVALLGVLRPADDHVAAPTGMRDSSSTLAAVMAGRHAVWRIIAGGALIAVGLVLVGASHGISSGVHVGVYTDHHADDPRRDGAARSVAGQGGAGDHRRAAPTHPPRRTRGDGGPPARLGAADARPHPAHGRRLAAPITLASPAGGRGCVPVAVQGNARQPASTTLTGALQTMVDEVEDLYDIPRRARVGVGDPTDRRAVRLRADSARSARRASTPPSHGTMVDVSVYVEIQRRRGPRRYCTIGGVGFDVAAVHGRPTGISQLDPRPPGTHSRRDGRSSRSVAGSGPPRSRLSVPLDVMAATNDETRR